MAFKFNWPNFDREFYRKAKEMLTVALNKGEKPDNIVDHIYVTDLYLGAQVSEEKFRGIFKLTYAGDAYLIMQTKVQVNPINLKAPHRTPLTSPGILAAHSKLVVPLQLKISRLKLRGIVVLVVSKNKGLTFCFKNDPLDDVAVNSSFDHLPNIRRDLQEKIEKQLRNLLNDELPSILHRLSLETKNNNSNNNNMGNEDPQPDYRHHHQGSRNEDDVAFEGSGRKVIDDDAESSGSGSGNGISSQHAPHRPHPGESDWNVHGFDHFDQAGHMPDGLGGENGEENGQSHAQHQSMLRPHLHSDGAYGHSPPQNEHVHPQSSYLHDAYPPSLHRSQPHHPQSHRHHQGHSPNHAQHTHHQSAAYQFRPQSPHHPAQHQNQNVAENSGPIHPTHHQFQSESHDGHSWNSYPRRREGAVHVYPSQPQQYQYQQQHLPMQPEQHQQGIHGGHHHKSGHFPVVDNLVSQARYHHLSYAHQQQQHLQSMQQQQAAHVFLQQQQQLLPPLPPIQQQQEQLHPSLSPALQPQPPTSSSMRHRSSSFGDDTSSRGSRSSLPDRVANGSGAGAGVGGYGNSYQQYRRQRSREKKEHQHPILQQQQQQQQQQQNHHGIQQQQQQQQSQQHLQAPLLHPQTPVSRDMHFDAIGVQESANRANSAFGGEGESSLATSIAADSSLMNPTTNLASAQEIPKVHP